MQAPLCDSFVFPGCGVGIFFVVVGVVFILIVVSGLVIGCRVCY